MGDNIQNPLLYYFAIVIVFGEVFFPGWFFHGMEDMHFTAILQFLSKIIFVILILLLVKTESDYENVLLYQAIGQIVSSIIALYILIIKYHIHLQLPKLAKIIFYLKNGWHIFASSFFVKMYNASNTIILGWVSNDLLVGYYAIAEKIMFAVSSLVGGPLNQVIYPHLAELDKNINEMNKSVFKYGKIMFAISSLAGISIFVLAEPIVYLITGEKNKEIILLVQILSFAIPLFPFGTFFTQILIIMEKYKWVSYVTIYTAVANYIILLPLVFLYSAVGVAVTVVFVRVVHIGIQLHFFKKIQQGHE
ncbi:MAG: hypothetical protein P794_05250 [Epsilonproteobacteria bacterium (ex Lamellibrachia satsuma)]|nr:MAG: hypothetical protein P794_05250 [Epsilonproteobacteria bacterium (ex Lamellibrachia satsuma)]